MYLLNEEGATTVLQLGNKPRVLAVNPLNELMLASPAVSGGALFLRSDGHLFCIAEKKSTGRVDPERDRSVKSTADR
jgi:hypothetical protein